MGKILRTIWIHASSNEVMRELLCLLGKGRFKVCMAKIRGMMSEEICRPIARKKSFTQELYNNTEQFLKFSKDCHCLIYILKSGTPHSFGGHSNQKCFSTVK